MHYVSKGTKRKVGYYLDSSELKKAAEHEYPSPECDMNSVFK